MSIKRAYRILKGGEDLLFTGVEKIIFLLMTLALISVVFQVIHRFVLIRLIYFPFPYSDELSRYAIVFTVYLAIPICLREGTQPAVDLLRELLPRTGQIVLYLVIKAVLLFCLVLLLRTSIGFVNANIYTSPTLMISGKYLYAMPLTGFALMMLNWVVELLGVIGGDSSLFPPASGKVDSL